MRKPINFIQGQEDTIKSQEANKNINDGTIYVSTDTGTAYLGMPDSKLLQLKADSSVTLETKESIILEGDTSNNIWHYRFYSNGFVDYYGRNMYLNVSWPKMTWRSAYGWDLSDVKFADFPVALKDIRFKKAECFPEKKVKFASSSTMGQNFLSTLSSYPYIDDATGKFTCPGNVNCYRLEPCDAQNVFAAYFTSGNICGKGDITSIIEYRTKLENAIKAYNETGVSQFI